VLGACNAAVVTTDDRRIMNKIRKTPILTAILFLTMWCATSALGGLSLTNIPCANSDAENDGRAITLDGKYVGGLSGTANGYFYDVANNYVTIPLAGSYAAIITGIGYRTDTNQVPAVVQVVLDGNNSGYHGQYETSDGGLTWGFKRRDNTGTTYAWADYPPSYDELAGSHDRFGCLLQHFQELGQDRDLHLQRV
jgi:hypothetical protein